MKHILPFIAVLFFASLGIKAQNNIKIDTTNFEIQAKAYVLEQYKGQDAIYLQAGGISPKNLKFLNGTIEYDIYLKEQRGFPGIYFRMNDNNGEQWYIRPHQDGNPDANQALGVTNGIAPWQLYFGTRYSFPYNYTYDDWTHVKIVVNGNKAQVFLDHSETPNLSWNLFHEAKEGGITITSGGATGLYIANVSIDVSATELVDFNPIGRKPIDGLIESWEVSDMFEEEALNNLDELETLISDRTWQGAIKVEEGTAANISRIQALFNGKPGNTVFAKVEITSEKDQLKMLEFGYSDRAVVVLNGNPLYRGTNNFRSRDYRYLGTIGLFDAVYLDLKKGKNTLLIAVSENFGGWLVTGRIENMMGISIK